MGASFVDSISQKKEYQVNRHLAPIDIRLDGNEGPSLDDEFVSIIQSMEFSDVNQYPDYRELLDLLSKRHGVQPSQVVITAGGDDGLARACRAFLKPGAELVLPVPTFEMIPRFALSAGATIVEVPWQTELYPIDDVCKSISSRTRMIAVVSPNNPTGGIANSMMLKTLAAKAPDALLLIDEAYNEFAHEELMPYALELSNAVVFRTLSKAWGFAGLRLGYAVGPEQCIEKIRASGLPYPVSTPSVRIATYALQSERTPSSFVKRVKLERDELREVLSECGISTQPSSGNFVYATGVDGAWWRNAMAGMGIGVRAWPDIATLQQSIRITCPGDETKCNRVKQAIRTIAQPEAILFDVDGVLINVSDSYDAAISETVYWFGGQTDRSQIHDVRTQGNANNDWILTQRILTEQGIFISLEDVKSVFEACYQNKHRSKESLLGRRDLLNELSKDYVLGVVTGRPRQDWEYAVEKFSLHGVFHAAICMEDAPQKPDPTPVKRAMRALDVERAWLLGDTVDDMRAAR